MTRIGRPRVPLVIGIATFALLLAAGGRDAHATGLSWINPAGGNAGTASNWSPAQVPVAADFLTFNLNSSFTTTFNATTPASSGLRFRDGIVTLIFSTPHTVSQTIFLAEAVNDTTTATITSGTLTSNGLVSIAHTAPAKGTLRVSGGDAVLVIQGASSDLGVGTVGNGTLEVRAGGSVEISDDVLVGANSGGVGALTVTGRSIVPLVPSNLTTLNSTSDFLVGDLGNGTFNIEGFGSVFSSGNMYIGPREFPLFNGNGVANVGEGGSNIATMTVDRDLWIGAGFGVAGGDGTVNIKRNGVLNVNGTTHLGANGNADAILHVEGGIPTGRLTTASLVLDDDAVFDFDGGEVTVDGGTLDTDGLPLSINSTVGSSVIGPRLTLTNNATATVPDTGLVSIRAGTTGYGEIRATNGGQWQLSQDLILGESAGGMGVLRITTAGSLTGSFTQVEAGGNGAAQIFITSGGMLTVSGLDLGIDIDGSATMSVTDAGTIVTANSIVVGAGVAAAEPVTVLSVSSNAVVQSPSNNQANFINGNGGLSLNSGGTFTMPGDLSVDGEVNMNGGSLIADSVLVNQSGGELNGKGTVTAKVSNSGTVAPGLSAGKLTVTGTYRQTSTGALTIELGSHTMSEWDTLAISGAAVLGGVLDLERLPTFFASSGDPFTIVTFASRSGTFSSVTLDDGPLLGFTVDYNATNVTLKATGTTLVEPSSAPAMLKLVGHQTELGAEFELALPQDSYVRLSVFDVEGREVAVLRDGREGAGRHAYDFGNGLSRVASGVYFGRAIVNADTASKVRTARVMIVR